MEPEICVTTYSTVPPKLINIRICLQRPYIEPALVSTSIRVSLVVH